MKKINFTLAIVFLMKLTITSGQYFTFPTDSVSWTNIGYTFGDQTIENSRVHFGLLGDTIINGHQYSKMYRNPNFWNGVQNTYSCFNPPVSVYTAAIREDDNKKVWYINKNETEEYILYDFDLELGDTFCSNIEQPSTGDSCFQVVLVDSILINGNYRRQIHFEDLNGSESWIEGIGSTTWSLVAQWSLIGNVGSVVECYYEGGNLIYGNSTFCSCDGTGTSIKPELDKFRSIKVYPNPFSDQTNIEFYIDYSAFIQLKIYNSIGKKVYTLETNLSQGIQRININKPLIPGIYYANLTVEGKTKSIKIIKH